MIIFKKRTNYELKFNKKFEGSLIYNETQARAFKDLSKDTQSIVLDITRKFKNNINISFNSNLDVKNNYDPYKSKFKISLFDDCSQLDISYSNTRFNDNFNTQPEEKISFTYIIDYLGFLDTNNQLIYFSKNLEVLIMVSKLIILILIVIFNIKTGLSNIIYDKNEFQLQILR